MTRLLTAREVAIRLDVSTETVLRWTRRGDLPALRLPGGAIRFREDALEGWLEERATSRRGRVTTPDDDAARNGRYGGKIGLVTTPSSEGEEV